MARRGRAPRRSIAAVNQLPWRAVTNPHGGLAMLDDDQLEAIHDASITILEELGIKVGSPRARALFESKGALVDHDTEIVRLGRDIVDAAITTAPSAFELTPRNPAHAVKIGGNNLVFGLVAGPPSVHDCERGRRQSNMADYENFIRLAHYFNAIHIIGNQVSAPMELQANNRHLDTYNANLTLSDLSFHCTAIGRGRALDGIEMMAISRGLSLDELAESPGVITIININSPRLLDDTMAEGLMTMAEYGQAVAVTPFTLMGAMTPVTLAAALAQQNAEALFGLTLTQLVKPGAPVMYGAFTSNVDMKSGSPAFGTPENAKANVAAGQLARRYGIPYRSSNASASNVVDAQAAYETQMSLWGAVLGGANMIYHAAGWMEGGLQASYEKLVLDVEMLQHMMEFLTPPEVDDAELGLDAMRRVPPGGHFFGDQHTLDRYESAFYSPILSDWQTWESWSESGALTATQRATAVWKAALGDYEQPPMDDAVRDSLDDYIARRKIEIGDDEP